MPGVRRRSVLQSSVIRCQITNGEGTSRLSPHADLIQIREPAFSTRELAIYVRQALKLKLPGRILVNDRLDVALATGAAGVHLKSNGISPKLVRQLVPKGFLITVACHDLDEVLSAEGADYVLLSPVFSPLSKVDCRRPLGLDELNRIAKISPIPALALGGINEANSASCIEAGADGVAGISLFST